MASIRRFHTLKQCNTYNGRGDWNQKYHNDDKQRTCEKGRGSSFFSALALLRLPLNFFGKRHVKKTVAELLTVALRRENWLMVRDNPGRWSRKAGGRYSQCSFCMKLSVHEKVVVGSRWSLKPGFTVLLQFLYKQNYRLKSEKIKKFKNFELKCARIVFLSRFLMAYERQNCFILTLPLWGINWWWNSVVITSRNSSVGRALDWRSKGPWFNPGFRQAFFFSFSLLLVWESVLSQTHFFNYLISRFYMVFTPFYDHFSSLFHYSFFFFFARFLLDSVQSLPRNWLTHDVSLRWWQGRKEIYG